MCISWILHRCMVYLHHIISMSLITPSSSNKKHIMIKIFSPASFTEKTCLVRDLWLRVWWVAAQTQDSQLRPYILPWLPHLPGARHRSQVSCRLFVHNCSHRGRYFGWVFCERALVIYIHICFFFFIVLYKERDYKRINKLITIKKNN